MRNSLKGLKKRASTCFDQRKIVKVFKNQSPPKPGEKFVDTVFPPNENSLLGKDASGNFIDPKESNKAKLINVDEIEWKRSRDIFPQELLFEGRIAFDDIYQGKIGNCYFLSALAAMCKFPGLIEQIFISKDVSKSGFYQVILWIDGEYQIVFLDDYFPVVKGTNVLYFAKPNSFELWAILLEKAWAKINGGYANIVSGWPSDVFRAFTGYACEQVNHKDSKIDRLWGIIDIVNRFDGLICCSTKNDDVVIKKGLIKNHAYSVLKSVEVEVNEKKRARLILLRNPWGYKEWNGDWCDGSPLWTEEIKKQVKEYQNKDDGSFWMSIEDVHKYFTRTDICQIVYGAKVQLTEFTAKDLAHPQVLDLYLDQQGILSVSLIEKNWRYNRELRDKSHPTSLMIGEYDPNIKTIKHVFTDFECFQDVEKSRILNPGYYVIWFYKAMDIYQEPKPDRALLKIASNVLFRVKPIGPDTDFKIAQEIVCFGIRHSNRNMIKNDEPYYAVGNSFKESGLAYRAIINPVSTSYQQWDVDASKIENIELLPPYKGQQKFSFGVPPNGQAIVLGIQKNIYGKTWFNLESKVLSYECRDGEEPVKQERIEFDKFCKNDVNKENPRIDFTTSTVDILSRVIDYPKVDHIKIWTENLSSKYPVVMKNLLELEPTENDEMLNWVVLTTPNSLYVGQANFVTREGRGGYYFKDEGTTWIGYWKDGEKCRYGKYYGKGNKLVYEGEYSDDGKRNGKGILYFGTGEKYEGEFVDNKREGKGIFYWDSTSRWEGNFKDNEMDGEGTYYEGTDSYPVEYKMGEPVEK